MSKPKNRRSKEQLHLILNNIRQLIIAGRTNNQIMKKLNIPKRTFYRYLDKIYEQDKLILSQYSEDALRHEFLLLRDRLLKVLQQSFKIAESSTAPAGEQIKALKLAMKVSIDIFRLMYHGPIILQRRNYSRNDKGQWIM